MYEKIRKADVIMFNAPTQKFRATEFKALVKFLESGKHIIYLASDGGEPALNTNFNHLLENFNIFVNNDGCIRTSYYKYLHPKEVLITNGVVDEDFIRVANSQEKKVKIQQKNRLKFAIQND